MSTMKTPPTGVELSPAANNLSADARSALETLARRFSMRQAAGSNERIAWEYIDTRTPEQLQALGLRRVAEEAGQDVGVPCEVCGDLVVREPVLCEGCFASDEADNLRNKRAFPAHGGEAPGGGEIQANYSDTNGCIAEPVTTTNSANLPPPTAAPEREAGDHSWRVVGGGEAYLCDGCGLVAEAEGAPPTLGCPGTGTARPDARPAEVESREPWYARPKQWDERAALRAQVAELQGKLECSESVIAKYIEESRADALKNNQLEAQVAELQRTLNVTRDGLEQERNQWQDKCAELQAERDKLKGYERTVRSLAYMLGWRGEPPPQATLERDVAAKRKLHEENEAKLEAARALLVEAKLALVAGGHAADVSLVNRIDALASDSPTSGKDGR